jgi:predicted acylesterase/phospholipase RssA
MSNPATKLCQGCGEAKTADAFRSGRTVCASCEIEALFPPSEADRRRRARTVAAYLQGYADGLGAAER